MQRFITRSAPFIQFTRARRFIKSDRLPSVLTANTIISRYRTCLDKKIGTESEVLQHALDMLTPG